MTNTTSGILKLTDNGAGVLRTPEDLQHGVAVPAKLVRNYHLVEGATVTGSTRSGKGGAQLATVETVSGMTPEAFQQRTPFRQLVAIDPTEPFKLSAGGDVGMRLIDLLIPIGKGTRGLIVAPPKAGKTILIEQIGKGMLADNPETRLIVLLIDERPEEVTHFRRTLPAAEVFASSSDQPVREHTELSELMLAHVRTELECGRDVVVLVDSLTRLVRAFNLQGARGGRSRTLSGGVEAEALQIPRRLFGLARNIENGGSVTILASVLIDTGSRMDDFIFEEFKGTGNSEIVLDRSLAEAYIFPAINLTASSTRKEEQLRQPDAHASLIKLRRDLVERSPQEAILLLLNLLAKYSTNEDLLQNL
ncbi:MAG TPA: transcription termination factor Rho [Anaerolineae bacterium]|nr:transcription termination factor Rho [Anaerolineae bacterium]